MPHLERRFFLEPVEEVGWWPSERTRHYVYQNSTFKDRFLGGCENTTWYAKTVGLASIGSPSFRLYCIDIDT